MRGQRRVAKELVGVLAGITALFVCMPVSTAQQTVEEMGAVATRDARLSGGLEVQGNIARLLRNVSVTATDRDAPIALHRGGHVLVCATSEFHLLRSGSEGALLFGLDRGAVEINTESLTQDAVLTPDLKFTPVTKGELDLRLRVTREGDTCVENAGAGAPVLQVSDPFSSASYRVLPGQHLLFVKGDLHRVVDHERSSCGCPAVTPQPAISRRPGQPASAADAAAANPFPQAQSEGLAAITEPANEAEPGTASSQVTTTFSYGEGKGRPPGADPIPSPATPSTPATPESSHGFLHAVRRFFHHLFHPSA